MSLKKTLSLVALGLACQVSAQTYDANNVTVQTFAGSGFSGYVNGVGQQTMFKDPTWVVADSRSNLFVWDYGNSQIRKITPVGEVSAFAGGGLQTSGVGTNVAIGGVGGSPPWPVAMTIGRSNTIWVVAQGGSPALYRITSNAVVTVASLPSGFLPNGICADSIGNLYFSDLTACKIYRYTTSSTLEVFAGSGNQGSQDGVGIFTSFNSPAALAVDLANNVYVLDGGRTLIRRIDQSQRVTTLVGNDNVNSADGLGTAASLGHYINNSQMCFDTSGNLIIVCAASIRRVSAANRVTTIAGAFDTLEGYANGAGSAARFRGALGVCFSGGSIYVADTGNQRIRSISYNPAPQPVVPANLKLQTYAGLEITGTVGRTYQIQGSPDMTNWTTRATLLLSSTPYQWTDQTPVAGTKFYRAFLLP